MISAVDSSVILDVVTADPRHGGARRRIVADFLIGAHAKTLADRLVARDRGYLRDYFSGLKLLDPSSPG